MQGLKTKHKKHLTQVDGNPGSLTNEYLLRVIPIPFRLIKLVCRGLSSPCLQIAFPSVQAHYHSELRMITWKILRLIPSWKIGRIGRRGELFT